MLIDISDVPCCLIITLAKVDRFFFQNFSDGCDTNFIYILLASERQQRNNEEH